VQGVERTLVVVAERVETIERRVDGLAEWGLSIEQRIDDLQDQMLHRFDLLETDLKRFTGIVNEALVHFGEEFDRVRDRLDLVEDKLGIAPPVD